MKDGGLSCADCDLEAVADGISVSSYVFLELESTESELGSRFSPTLPSFSTTATKLVRILDSGRGDSVPADKPGDLPRSGVSSLLPLSNIARRPETDPILLIVTTADTAVYKERFVFAGYSGGVGAEVCQKPKPGTDSRMSTESEATWRTVGCWRSKADEATQQLTRVRFQLFN